MKVKDGFGEYLDYLQKTGRAENTIKKNQLMLKGSVSHTPLSERNLKNLKLSDTQAELISSGKTHGEWGPTETVIVFRNYLKFLKDSGIKIPFDYRELEVPRVPEKQQVWMTVREYNSFVKSIPKPRDRALYVCLMSTGARISEMLSLNRDSINWQKKEAIVKDCKSGEEGKIYLSDCCLACLKEYNKSRRDECPALFIAKRNGEYKRMANSTARRNLKVYREKFAKGKKITHHSFRRSLATLLLEKGATLKETQYLLRHKSERTTLRYYCQVNKDKAKSVHQRILARI